MRVLRELPENVQAAVAQALNVRVRGGAGQITSTATRCRSRGRPLPKTHRPSAKPHVLPSATPVALCGGSVPLLTLAQYAGCGTCEIGSHAGDELLVTQSSPRPRPSRPHNRSMIC